MFTQLLLTIAIIANLLHIPFAQAWQEHVALVPTETIISSEKKFEWRVIPQSFLARKLPKPQRVDSAPLPNITAQSAVIMDAGTRQILWQKNPDEPVSIASITKLATVLVWFDHMPQERLRHVHTFAPEDRTPGGKELHLEIGEKLTTFDLLRSALVGSDNDAALALAHTTGLPVTEFVRLMNAKAKELGMKQTMFADPTGLEAANRAAPHDVALLALAAFANDNIRIPTTMREHLQETTKTEKFSRVRTTDKLLYDEDVSIRGGKTGYTLEAGYCFVALAHLPQDNHDIIIVVLGASSDDMRFIEAKELMQWTEQHYDWYQWK